MEKHPKLEAVLFDVDGTLREVPLEYIHHCQIEALRPHTNVDELMPDLTRLAELRGTKRFINEARDFMEFLTYLADEKKTTLDSLHASRHDGRTLDAFMQRKRQESGKPTTLEDSYKRYRLLRDGPEAQKAIRPIRGALETLRRIRSQGIPVCLVSNAAGVPLREWLSDHGLKGIAVVSKEDVQHQKPHPQGIKLACRKLRIKAGMHVAYVGDQPNDVVAAIRAGVRAIAVPYRGNESELKKEKPDHLFSKIAKIERHIGKAGVPARTRNNRRAAKT